MEVKLEQLKLNIFFCMHHLKNIRMANSRLCHYVPNPKVVFANVQLAKNECEFTHNIKVLFEKVQFAKNVNNVKKEVCVYVLYTKENLM